jgi:hypothetical protein
MVYDPKVENPSSFPFLVPLSGGGGPGSVFDIFFLEQKYPIAFASDYFGVAGGTTQQKLNALNSILSGAKTFHERTGILPKIWIDLKGFEINTQPSHFAITEASPYVYGYHVVDEPDICSANCPGGAGTPNSKEHPSIVESTRLAGLPIAGVTKPMVINFTVFVEPSRRQFLYVDHTDEYYLDYILRVAKYSAPGVRNYIGYDHYTFMLSWQAVPTDLTVDFTVMESLTDLVSGTRADPSRNIDHSFGFTEPVYQGLQHICNIEGQVSRPRTPDELRAQFYTFLVAGNAGMRADFQYIFNHLCLGTIGSDWNGLDHSANYYIDNGHKAVVVEENERFHELNAYIDAVNDVHTASNSAIKVTVRDPGAPLHPIAFAVNFSNQTLNAQTIQFDAGFSSAVVLWEDRSETLPAGLLTDDWAPYEVHRYELH